MVAMCTAGTDSNYLHLFRRKGVSGRPATGVADVSIGEWMGIPDPDE